MIFSSFHKFTSELNIPDFVSNPDIYPCSNFTHVKDPLSSIKITNTFWLVTFGLLQTINFEKVFVNELSSVKRKQLAFARLQRVFLKEQRVPKAHDLVRNVNQQWNCYSERNKYFNRLKRNLKLKSTFNSTNSSSL